MSVKRHWNNGLFKDLTGYSFGRWLVLHRAEKIDKAGRALWTCRCDCGTVRDVIGKSLRRGVSHSCGCLTREKTREGISQLNYKHGMTNTRAFNIWTGMLNRCYNRSNSNYPLYGARGVRVCDRWKASFEAFVADMGEPPDGMTIDRFPNAAGNYEPSNCRWATLTQQSRNRPTYNRIIEYNGRSATIAEWSDIAGLPYQTLYSRIYAGWTVERALTAPRRRHL